MRLRSILAMLLVLSSVSSYGRTEHSDSVRSLGETGVEAVMSLGINAAVTEGLKHSIHEMRPNHTGNNSFPSRHSSWAFAASTVVSNELYRESPFWSLGAQLVASSIGMQRVMSRSHYASDVIAGASIGIASTELAYLIARKVFRRRSLLAHPSVEDVFGKSMSVRTEALYWIGRWSGMKTCTGLSTSLEVTLPVVSTNGALVFAATVVSNPFHTASDDVRTLDGIGLSAGWKMSFPLGARSLSFRPSAKTSLIRTLTTKDIDHSIWGFGSDISGDFSWRLTHSFGVSLGVGGRLVVVDKPLFGIGVSVASVAYF